MEQLVDNAIRQGVFPGLELLVARGDEVLLHQSWGRLEQAHEAESLETGTLFDVASLTKPVVTATCLMILVEQGLTALEERVARFFPEFANQEKTGITLRHLLTHTSGLDAWANLYEGPQTAAEALAVLLNQPLKHPTGTVMLYSDLGYLLLAEIIRKISGKNLAEFYSQQVAHPLLMANSAFNPLEQGWRIVTAPTQYCVFRKQLLRGIVHDENAFRFNGEGGNAGLFSTAPDLHRFARMVLRQGELEGVRVLSAATVRLMTANHNPPRLAPRGLGWDMKGQTPGYVSCGDLMAPGTIGHTGFTGTSLWMEPDSGLTIIALSNRINIAREKNQQDMIEFRPRLHNVLAAQFGA